MEKSYKPAGQVFGICLLLGMFGVHRFFVGKTVTGILMLLTLGLFGIWIFIDLLLIAFGVFADSKGRDVSWK